MEEEELGDTVLVGNEWAQSHEVEQHFRTGHRGETHIKHRQVPQKKIHGCVKPIRRKNGYKDGHVSQQGAGIEGQEQDKEYSLQPFRVRDSQQDELSHLRAVLHLRECQSCGRKRKQKTWKNVPV